MGAMKSGRYLGVGILLVLAGGCATQNKPPVGSSTPSAQVKTSATQPLESPKWEASSTPAELLAQRTAEFAKTVQPDSVQPDTPIPQPPEISSALLGGPEKRHHKAEITRTAPPVDASPITQPGSVLTPGDEVAKTGPVNDGPRIMPESADFSVPDSASKDELGTRLRKRTHQNPKDIADQLDLQLYGLLNDDPSPELASFTELSSDDRELVAALIDGLSNFRSAVREDSNMLQAKKIQPLLEMADRLRSQADLTVSTVALCKRVDGFGKYEPISPLRFPATKENAAIVYCEVENFLTKQQGAMWQTRLTEQVTLYTDMGMLAWSDDKREVLDECRNRRHDFFAYNIIKLPSSLTVGRYLLKVSIEDKNADKVAEATVPLEIVGK
jgi:hypothetical protein